MTAWTVSLTCGDCGHTTTLGPYTRHHVCSCGARWDGRVTGLGRQRRKPPPAERVYFVRREDGLVKVGYTTNLEKRLVALRRQHGPLEVLRVEAGGREREAELHQAFADDRVYGEWFAADAGPDNYLAMHLAADWGLIDPAALTSLSRDQLSATSTNA